MAHPAIRQYQDEEHLTENDIPKQAVEEPLVVVEDHALDTKEPATTQEAPSNELEDNEQVEGEYYHYTVDTKDPDPWLEVHKFKIITVVLIAVIAVAGKWFYDKNAINQQTKAYIASPVIGDLYYLDFRLVQDNLRPTEKFRMAKVTDITGDVVTINYSSYFYLKSHELTEAIRYGQLRFGRFFQQRRHDLTIPELEAMIESGAILRARRPDGNVLDGNVVVPDKQFANKSSLFIPGKKENSTGMELMKLGGAVNEEQAYKQFSNSAAQGYAPGQVNLAQMYLTGAGVSPDKIEALAILKQAAFQSHEPAVLKYSIVCKKVESCMVADFYEELVAAGVNIKFSEKTQAAMVN